MDELRGRCLTTVAVLAMVVSGAGIALAQDAQNAQNANPPQGGGNGVTLDTVTVTATKTVEHLIDVLGGVSTVTQQDIDRVQPSRISDLLRNVPGVSTQDSANDPMQSINIRGLQDFGRVNVLVDGARQDYQISGHNANGSFYLDPEFIDQIDIVKGPISNIYGSGAIGGVASFTTRGVDSILAPDETWGGEQKVGFSSNGLGAFTSSSAAARYGTLVDIYGQFIYRDTGSYRAGGGDRVQDSGSNNFGGLFKVNYHPGDGQTISLSALGQNYRYDNNGTSNEGSRWRNDVDTQTYTAGYKYESPETPLINFNAKVYYSQTENRQTILAPDATYSALGVVPGDRLFDRIGTTGFDVYNTSRFSTGPVEHALTYGGDGAFDRVTTEDAAGGYISALTPSGTRSLLGAYVQDEMRYDGWLRVLGGLRYDDYSLKGGSYGSSGSHWSPKITIGVTPVKGIELYGTYAEGYRAPSITETLISGTHPYPAFPLLPNPALRPETGHDFEVGANVKYDDILQQGDTFRAKVTGFVNNVDDYIDMAAVGPSVLVPYIPGMPSSACSSAPYLCFPITAYQYVNIARARLMGAEFEAAYDWGQGFASISGSHTNGENRDTHVPLSTVAPNKISGTLGWRFLDNRLTVGTRATFVGATSRRVDLPSGGYGLVDVFASYKYSDNLSADFAVDNVFDRRYKAFLDSDYSPGIAAKFSITYKFASK